jgi:hypothetical protein
MVIKKLDKQQLLYFPPSFLQDAEPEKHFAVEYRERGAAALELVLVNIKKPAMSKRYKIVRHHGSACTSIPEPFLKNLRAKVGDEIEVQWSPTTALLTFKRNP